MAKHHSHSATSIALTIRNDSKKLSEFLVWPSHMLGMLLGPRRNIMPEEAWRESWNDFTPLEAWVEQRRAHGPNASRPFPKTESRKTHKTYLYTVKLPGISRDQITLNIWNGAIVLKINTPLSHEKNSVQYLHIRSIHRSFGVPIQTNGEAITAELKGETLKITIPKSDKPIARHSHAITII